MVDSRKSELDRIFQALGDPTRRSILRRLVSGDASVGELAKRFPISLAAVSKHLMVLEEAGLIARTRSGRHHHLRLRPKALRKASEWIEFYRGFWDARLDALSGFLEGGQAGAPTGKADGGSSGAARKRERSD
jgi:DNA-binding transcriptional ArsR family regulator